MPLTAFIAGLPKAELHCHIEGTLEPEMLVDMAARNGVALPYDSVDAVRAAYRFDRLQDFLDIYYQGMAALCTERDFYDLARAYLENAAAQNIRHLELFFDPQAHVARGVPFGAVVDGLTAALESANRDFGITSQLIMCFLRHLPPQDARDTLAMAAPYRAHITGIGLDSSELDHPPQPFAEVFAEARAQGYRCVAHAGEEGPAAYIEGALDALQVERIDHGNAAIDDEKLLARLAEEKTPLTMCPLSNLKLRVIERLSAHPIKRMFDLGLHVTVNSDDPAYFGGHLNDNYAAIADALELDAATLAQLARNSVTASFAGSDRQRELLDEIDAYSTAAMATATVSATAAH